MKFCFVAGVLLGSFQTLAQTDSSTGTSTTKIEKKENPIYIYSEAKTQNTTDDIYLRTLNFNLSSNEQLTGILSGEWNYNFDSSGRDGRTLSDDFKAQKVSFGIGHNVSKEWRIEASGGEHILKTKSWFEKAIPDAYAQLSWSPVDENGLSVSYTHDFVYQDWVSPSAVDEALSADTYSLNFFSRPIHKLRLAAREAHAILNDGNNQEIQEASALYGLSADWPWIWAGVGALRYSFSKYYDEYWSPAEWMQFGPRFESSIPVARTINFLTNLQLNYSHERNQTPTFCKYAEVALNYKTESLELTARFVKMGDLPGYSGWQQDDYGLSLSSHF